MDSWTAKEKNAMAPAMPGPELSVSHDHYHCSPASVMFPELERSIDISWLSIQQSYLLCFGHLHISVITSEHCKKKLLWSKLTAVWYGNKHSCLYGNLVGRFCLLQHVGHMEAWLFHDMHVCVHAWHLAVEVKLTAQHPSVYRTTPNSKQLSIL